MDRHRWAAPTALALALALLGVLSGRAAGGGEPADPAARLFLDRVKPLLEQRCISCHGSEKQKGGLRLDSRAAALKGGELGPSVVPGKPGASLLVAAVTHAKPDLEMPPKDKLSPAETAMLERWIRDGAPWPEVDAALATSATAPAAAAGDRLGNAWEDPRKPTVAPEALSLLNGADALRAARALGERVARETPGDPQGLIDRLLALTLQRAPLPGEAAACEEFLRRHGPVQLGRALLNLNEFALLG